MSQMSDYLEVEIRKHIFRTGSFTKPTVLAIALCTAAPTDALTGATITEVANSYAYARQALNPLDANWTAPDSTGGVTANASLITFPAASGGNWGTITHIAICDSAAWGAGNMLFYGALTASKTITDGEQFKINAGSLTV